MQNDNKNEKSSECMLTTLDNPFNPFTEFDKWNQFDQEKGYNTLSYLGRIVDYTGCITEEQRRKERERAISEIIYLNPLQIYCKVSKDEKVLPISTSF